MLRYLLPALKLVTTLAILGVFVWQLDPRAILRAVATVHPVAILASLGVMALQSVALAMRLVVAVSSCGSRIAFGKSYRITLESMFFSQTFISLIGGDAFRIWRLRRYGLPLAAATSSVMLDRIVGTLVNHICLLVSLSWLLTIFPPGAARVALIVLACGGVAVFAAIALVAVLARDRHFLSRLPDFWLKSRVSEICYQTSRVFRNMVASPSQLNGLMLLSAVVAACSILAFAFLFVGMDVDRNLVVPSALLVPAVLEVAMIPFSAAGWGLREGAAIVAFGALGMGRDVAFGSSVIFGLITTFGGLVGAVVWLLDRDAPSKTDDALPAALPGARD